MGAKIRRRPTLQTIFVLLGFCHCLATGLTLHSSSCLLYEYNDISKWRQWEGTGEKLVQSQQGLSLRKTEGVPSVPSKRGHNLLGLHFKYSTPSFYSALSGSFYSLQQKGPKSIAAIIVT